MGNGDSRPSRRIPESGCVFYGPEYPGLYWHGSHRTSSSTSHDGSQRSTSQQQPENHHSGVQSASTEARANSVSNGSAFGSGSLTAPSIPYCDPDRVWCPYHRRPYSRCYSWFDVPGPQEWLDAHRADARSASAEARASNSSSRSSCGSESVYAPSSHYSQRSAGYGSARAPAFRAGEDQVFPITDSMLVYYSEPGRAKGLIRHRKHRSKGERGGSMYSGSTTRSSGYNASAAHSRQVYVPVDNHSNATSSRSGRSSGSVSHSGSHRLQARDEVAVPYSATGRSPQRHRRVDIFGNEHSPDSGSSSGGESEGGVGSVGEDHAAEETHRIGYRVQFVIPERERQSRSMRSQ